MFKTKYLLTVFCVVIALFITACTASTKEEVRPSKPPGNRAEVPSKNAYYFTANEGGSISKIDAATNQLVSTQSVEGSVHNVQVSPDGKIIGVTVIPKAEIKTMNEEKKIKGFAIFYDIETDKLIKKVDVGNNPSHIVFTADGKYILVSNNGDNNVSVIDTKTYEIIKTISTGSGPHGFRISNYSKFAYVANMKEDTVSVLDLTNFVEVKKIKVGKAPMTTAVTSDGNTMVVSLNGEDSVAIVDIKTDKIEKIPVGKGPVQVFIQSDDRYAFVANQGTEKNPSDTISKINLTTKKVSTTIPTGKGAHGVVTSNDNKYVYVTNMYDDTVSVINNDMNSVLATVKVGNTPNGISYKP
ncbi:hypothetical protein CPJCM30710_12190 [Clostridium polyendosporum]|uniref:YNCE-like beta-propeller domain-containing protein n=1 Tax=Clostridium polyendosporum TaxID=69208 RepID=A0A919S0V2_9CLOT|nr:YncE family protein [Clostridium polyendosporum]GIM28553.1 hypothetical protein CPJCM30710_12190 [Clostridium polyendosporum]